MVSRRVDELPARIFVVDDDPILLRMLRLMLTSSGHEAVVFSDGQAALDAVAADAPDLILTDLNMTGLGGFEVLQGVRDRAPGLPVVMVTASGELKDAVRAIRDGAAGYVVKPIDPEVLEETLGRILRMKRLERQNRLYTEELARKNALIARELELAREIQAALLPPTLPSVPGLELAVLWEPSGDIGGDLYDVLPGPEGLLRILLADISGHGIPAALLSAAFKSVSAQAFHAADSAVEAFAEMNRRIARTFPNCHYASTTYAEIDPSSRKLRYVKAAQEPILIHRPGVAPIYLHDGEPILGAFDPELFGAIRYVQHEVPIEPGDVILLYTDGIVEMEDAGSRPLGPDGLAAWIREESARGPAAMLERIRERAREYVGGGWMRDDLTMMAVSVK